MINLTLQQAQNLHQLIENDPARYEWLVSQKLRKYCPQIGRDFRRAKARGLVGELSGRLLQQRFHASLAVETIDFLKANMLLFEDFISYTEKEPLFAECKALRFSDTELIILWMITADSVEARFPNPNGGNPATSTFYSGIKIMERGLANNQVILGATYYGTSSGIVEKRLSSADIIDLNTPYYIDLVRNWLSFYNVPLTAHSLPLGRVFDGSNVKNFTTYKVLEQTDYNDNPDEYGIYPIMSDMRGDPEMENKLQNIYNREHNFDYTKLESLIQLMPPLYAPITRDEANYVPIVNQSYLDLVRQRIDGRYENLNNLGVIPFPVGKEFLIRMRLEFTDFPVRVNMDDQLDVYNTRRKIRTVTIRNDDFLIGGNAAAASQKQLELFAYYNWEKRGCPTGSPSVDWQAARVQAAGLPQGDRGGKTFPVALGSKSFWQYLGEMDSRKPGAAADELQRVFSSPDDAEQVCACWQSADWDEFFETFFMIGIDPKTACRNTRAIVQMSDFHLGKNDGRKEIRNTLRCIGDFCSARINDDPKPLIVITGDTVDYADPSYLDEAKGILQCLADGGFRMLILPGNHDYSFKRSAVDIVPGRLAILDPTLYATFVGFVSALSEDLGYDVDKVSGITYDDGAMQNYRRWVRRYLPDWKDGHIYYYRENYLKPKSSLNIVLVDAQDEECDVSFIENIAGLDKSLFLGKDRYGEHLRLAKGWVNDAQLGQLKTLYDTLRGCDRSVFCVHHWMDYDIGDTVVPNSAQQLTTFLLQSAYDNSYNGSSVCVYGTGGGIQFQQTFFNLGMKNSLVPKADFKLFCDVWATRFAKTGAYIFDEHQQDYGQYMDYSQGPMNHNDNYDGDNYPNYLIVNEGSLHPFVARSECLLVGHRHHTHVQYLDQDLKDRIRAMATSVTKYADQQTIVVNDQQRFRRFLEGIQFFSEHYDQRTEDIKRRMIDAVMRIVTTTNLRVDTGEVYAKLAPAALDNYYECEDTSDKLKYLDIGVDLTRLPKI